MNESRYDIFLATVGFEQRSLHIAQILGDRPKIRAACAYDSRKVHAYYSNLSWFKKAKYRVEERKDSEFEAWCEEALRSVPATSRRLLRLAVDVSSMSRFRIAGLMACIREISTERQVQADFLYSPAKFSPPHQEGGPIVIFEPVTKKFAGWSDEPDKPSMAIFGLGYEEDKAVGALEYIEPSTVWAFRPTGEDEKYDRALKRANRTFWDLLPRRNIIDYRVDRPFECFANLESLTYGALRSGRPVLIPFGPKIFTACCLLVGLVHYPRVVVWRVSSGEFETAANRVATGKVVGVSAQFLPH